MQKWYKNSYRRLLVDMHIETWDDSFLTEFDSKTYYDSLVKANVKSAMIYLNSHTGYCNWDSESGVMHPGFGGVDKIKELTELCREGGIDVIAYYSLVYLNWVADTYPDWKMIDIHGRDNLQQGQRYGLVCPNNEGYRDFIKKQVKEFCANYDFVGIFLDMTFFAMTCYCDSCQAKYMEKYGRRIPEKLDWSDPEWVCFHQERENWIADFAVFATAEVKKYKPDVSVEHQFSSLTHSWERAVDERVSQASDYCGGDLYGGLIEQSFVCKLFRNTTEDQPFEFMTSRCDPDLSDHTTMKTKDMLSLHNYITMAHQGAFLIIDAIDPVGTLNDRFFGLIGEIFEESQVYEQYYGGEMLNNVNVFFSTSSKFDPEEDGGDSVKANHRIPHLYAGINASKMLKEAHIPFTVIGKYNLKDLTTDKLLILPEVFMLSDEEEKLILDFVRQGGNLYASGRTSPKLMSELLGLEYKNKHYHKVSFMAPQGEGLKLIPDVEPTHPLTIFGRQERVEIADKSKILAYIVTPYTDPYDNYKYASIHSNPPGPMKDEPAIVYGSYGKGRVMWTAGPIEMTRKQLHGRVFSGLIRELLDEEPFFKSDGPQEAEITLFDYKEKNKFTVSITNLQDAARIIPLSSFEVDVLTQGRKILAVRHLPDGKEIPFSLEGDYVRFGVDAFHIFTMYEVVYEEEK